MDSTIRSKSLLIVSLFFLLFIISVGKAISQDTSYISPNCFSELKLRCSGGKGRYNIKRIKINQKLIKADVDFLKRVQVFLRSKDSTEDFLSTTKAYVTKRQNGNTDSIGITRNYTLNYFSISVTVFLGNNSVIGKVGLIHDALTFYCDYDQIKTPNNYTLIDPIFFERYLRKNLKIDYFYYCREIYLNKPYYYW